MKKLWMSLCLLLPFVAPSQITQDPANQQLILKTLDKIYNYEFTEAEAGIRQLRARYPQHPIGPILRAIGIYWQSMPIWDNRTALSQYTVELEQALRLAEKMLAQDKDDPEVVFFALTAHGYLAMKYHYTNETMKAVGEARKAYGYLKTGFSLMDKNPEFYFTTGLYNYYVERYPQDHPVVKPFMVFFQDGDMALGVRQMETAIRRGLFTRTETALYLTHILLEHEIQPARAASLMRPLAERYPNNPLFTLNYTEALAHSGQYAEMENQLKRIGKMSYKFMAMPTEVLEGLLLERQDRNDQQAAVHYQQALKMPARSLTKEYHAHAYAGLARIAARAGDKNRARAYYKKVLDTAEYKSSLREARAYLKN